MYKSYQGFDSSVCIISWSSFVDLNFDQVFVRGAAAVVTFFDQFLKHNQFFEFTFGGLPFIYF